MDDTLEMARRVLSTTTARWQSLVETIPLDLLARRPMPGEWSALECLAHLLTIERLVIPVRVRHVLEGRTTLAVYDPEAPRPPLPERADELLAAFAAERRVNEDLVAPLTAEDLERRSYHPEFGIVTLRTLLSVWAAHDLQHTVQAEQAIMQTFIPYTGPWRGEFADHDVSAATQV